jgi:hypothetical protein
MDLDDCDAIFQRALSASSESDFCQQIEPLFDIYQIISVGLGRGSIWWRARSTEGAAWQNLNDLDYPPPDKARQGRLNDAGSPCFYVARDIDTALLEIEARPGQLVQVAGFRVLKEEMAQLIVIGEYANVQKRGYLSLTGEDPGGTLQKMLNGHDLQHALALIYIDRFLASILCDPKARQSGYRFSRALGSLLHSRIRDADGIAFPSVRDPGGFNFAVRPEPSDRIFHNVACLLVRIGKKRHFHLMDREIINSAQQLDANLNFVWPTANAPDQMNLYGMTKEEFETGANAGGDRDAMARVLSVYSPRRRN